MSANTVITVPAHILARQQARNNTGQKSSTMTAVINGDAFPYPKISTRASRYRLVEDGVETPIGINLDVIIVGANPNISKVYYSKPFDGNLDVRPDCFSNDGITPDKSITEPVSPSCTTCPYNVLGSKVNPSGAKSKMCADQRHLAVVPAADATKPYALTVPVSAMKNLREYFKELQNFGLIPEEVVTELGFDETVSFPKITFKQKGFVSEKAISKVEAIVQSEDVKEVVRLMPPRPRNAALSGPANGGAATALGVQNSATVHPSQNQPVAPVVDDAYEGESEVVMQAPAAKKVKSQPAPVAAAEPEVAIATAGSDDPAVASLEAKLDNIFADD